MVTRGPSTTTIVNAGRLPGKTAKAPPVACPPGVRRATTCPTTHAATGTCRPTTHACRPSTHAATPCGPRHEHREEKDKRSEVHSFFQASVPRCEKCVNMVLRVSRIYRQPFAYYLYKGGLLKGPHTAKASEASGESQWGGGLLGETPNPPPVLEFLPGEVLLKLS
jgi:hypothetical protein